MKVNTVLGPVDTKDLGFTMMHEHIINIEWNFAHAFPEFYDREATVELFCKDMETLKPLGVKTFVDATPITLGRDIELLRECSERAEVNIIACSGVYAQEYPFFHYGVDPYLLANYMIREFEKGMEGSDSKPAFVKCASMHSEGTPEINRNMVKATAIASLATGLPIYTHTDPGYPNGEFQQQIFEENGVDLTRVCFGHAFTCGDREYLERLTDKGSYIGCDQVNFLPADEEKRTKILDNLVYFIKSDKRKQVFISCDGGLRSDFGHVLLPDLRDRDTNQLVKMDGRKHSMFEVTIPYLLDHGVTQEMLDEVFITNPRRFFGETI